MDAQFSPDGLRVVTVSSNGDAGLSDTRTGDRLSEPLQEGLLRAAFAPDGHSLLTLSKNGQLQIWDIETGQPLSEAINHSAVISKAQFSSDGQSIVTISSHGVQILSLPPLFPTFELPELAEAMVGKRLDELSNISFVSVETFLDIKHGIEQRSSSDPFTRWAKMLLAERGTRATSPDP